MFIAQYQYDLLHLKDTDAFFYVCIHEDTGKIGNKVSSISEPSQMHT